MMYDVPFDLMYIPDFIFDTYFCKKAAVMPNDVEIQGTLALSPQIPVNIARLALIVDDYLIQFSTKGNVYILEIPNNRLISKTLVDFVNAPNGSNWLMQVALAYMSMSNGLESGGDSAFKRFTAYENVLQAQTFNTKAFTNNITFIQNNVGLADATGLSLKNGRWNFKGYHVTWGRIAHLLFKPYFENAFDWHNNY